MAKAIPNPEPPRGGGSQPWSTDELAPKDKLGGLAGLIRDPSLLRDPGPPPAAPPPPAPPPPPQAAAPMAAPGVDANLLQELQAENEELRAILTEAEQIASERDQLIEQMKEAERLIEERDQAINDLNQEMEGLKEAAAKPPVPREDELLAMSEELEKERCQLQQDRRKLDEELRQLREDTEVMNQEMRQMEMQMAKERAELARQRTEVQRINDEIRLELDRIERDRGLNDRLKDLRQKHMDLMKGKSIPPTRAPSPTPATTQMGIDLDAEQAGRHQQNINQPHPEDPKKKDSGLFRRLFGQG
ncbi:MAG: hypothetical protein AB7K24_23560 [Gemmataceae bacterium]